MGTMWERVLRAHPHGRRLGARGPLAGGDGMGCLYVADHEASMIYAVLATSPQAAWGQLVANDVAAQRADAIWVDGSQSVIRSDSPILSHPRSALRAGRPTLIRSEDDWVRVPRRAGIYRIHRVAPDGGTEVYVGKSLLLSRRPRHHEKTRGRAWGHAPGDVTMIELIAARPSTGTTVGTTRDLSHAEARHVQKMILAHGADRVLNITGGGNGRTGALPTHFAVWQPAG